MNKSMAGKACKLKHAADPHLVYEVKAAAAVFYARRLVRRLSKASRRKTSLASKILASSARIAKLEISRSEIRAPKP